MKTKLDILTAARELLAHGDRWTKERAAERADGLSTDVHARDAIRFCAVGALYRVSDISENGPYNDAQEAIASVLRAQSLTLSDDPFSAIVSWNDADDRTHADVIAIFDAAILDAQEPR